MLWGVIVVGSTGGTLSKVSVIVKSERLAMLIDVDCVMGDAGIVSVPGVVVDSSVSGWGIWGSGSVLGSPGDGATVARL